MKFTLTKEQEIIRDTDESLIITACAGAGKTSTFVFKAENHPNQKFLYLCFNKAIQEEANRKFPINTTCRTIHSLAYRAVGRKYQLTEYGNVSAATIKKDLNINTKQGEDDHWGFKIACSIEKKLGLFCASNTKSINDIDLHFYLKNPQALQFYGANQDIIDEGAEQLWKMMEDKEIPISHDFYVKKYSLEPIDLGFDWVLVDEAQDISPCFIDIINAQSGKKLICGDFSQAIYGWRGGVGDFSKYFPSTKTTKLSHSFRFKQDVADLCNKIISLKTKYTGFDAELSVEGRGQMNDLNSIAIVGRSNVQLLKNILDNIDRVDSIYIEGGLSSIINGGGCSVFDVLNLYTQNHQKIRNDFIRTFNTFEDLEDFVEDVEQNDLACIMEIVKKYKRGLFQYIKDIKSKEKNSKKDAELVFTTVHKSKGLEYDVVKVADNDFITEYILRNIQSDNNGSIPEDMLDRLNEEVNLLYVAASRAKNKLIIPNCFLYDNISDFLNKSYGTNISEYLDLKF